MTGIAAIDGGMSYHTRTLRRGKYARLFTSLIRPSDLGATDLGAFPTLLVPCRTNGQRLAGARAQLAAFMEAGGFLVVMGETRPDLFLDGVAVDPVPTNFWWWLENEGDLGLRITAPDHPLMSRLSQADLTWHVHGTLRLTGGGDTLAAWHEGAAGGPILIDSRRGRGRLLITTLDPIYHHGSGFMPATTRFLDVFLPWLAEETAAHIRGAAHV
ncbi:hypothetical protein [Rhodophyticola porphyridii]|uniref:hypothetical protein n=1 Tax=Rhodophyticola porphyridii TaxID=1852017 RepID=UPI0035D0BFE0